VVKEFRIMQVSILLQEVVLRGKACSFYARDFQYRLWGVRGFLLSVFFTFMMAINVCFAVNAQDTKDRAGWPDRITFGFVPYIEPAKVEKRYKPLVEHLEDCLGIKVDIVVPDNYLKILVAMKRKEVEFAYFGPLGYVQAHREAGAEVFAMELDRDGNPGYYALLIAKNGSGINTLDQGRGRVLAFSDPDSTSGYLVPLIHFVRDRKETPGSFASRIVFAGSHMAVVEGVAKGDYDIGATNTKDIVRSGTALGLEPDQFNILWKSELVPGSPIAAGKDVPDSLKQAFLDALLSFSQKRDVLEKMDIGGYIPAEDKDYKIVRELEAMKSK
jgi:phosphonate transport system substrate-binding protein